MANRHLAWLSWSLSALSVIAGIWANHQYAGEAGVPGYICATIVLMAVECLLSVWLESRLGANAATTQRFGFLIAAIFLIDLLVEYGIDTGRASGLLTAVFIAAILLCTGAAAYITAYSTRSMRCGIQAGLLAMLVGVGCLIGFGFLALLIAPGRLAAILQPEELHSVARAAFPFAATLEDAVTHLVEAPVLALIIGSLSALMGSRIGIKRSVPSA